MVMKYDTFKENQLQESIKVDVIILGCSLPGIVTAHKLKAKFGDTMDIVVLDLDVSSNLPILQQSKRHVAFQELTDDSSSEDSEETVKRIIDNVARNYLEKFTKDFSIPLPQSIIAPERIQSQFCKLFEYRNGQSVICTNNYYDFDYLSTVEKFELNQYHSLLDQSMIELFHHSAYTDTQSERRKLMYYDRTTMERHLCGALLFSNSRDFMRMTVRVVCGAPADTVSVLFYLHQCYRTCSSRNHLDGNNTRLREKLLGYCRHRITNKLQQSIADITYSTKSIEEIRTYSDEEVILMTMKGETNYICNLLAMALTPEELHNIKVETKLLSAKEAEITRALKLGRVKRFAIYYLDDFWKRLGYSGDIVSVRGPIIWAMERPWLSTTGSKAKYSSLVGFLSTKNCEDDDIGSSKAAVIEQLVRLFGPEAASPVSYREVDQTDVYVPRCGDYVALNKLIRERRTSYLEWGTLDIFADGDLVSALEAGHLAYLHLLTFLRPQAVAFEDQSAGSTYTILGDGPLYHWWYTFNYFKGMRIIAYTAALYFGMRMLKSFYRNN